MRHDISLASSVPIAKEAKTFVLDHYVVTNPADGRLAIAINEQRWPALQPTITVVAEDKIGAASEGHRRVPEIPAGVSMEYSPASRAWFRWGGVI